MSRAEIAGLQAYEYIAAENPGLPGRQLRRMAMQYLLLTASPPLTRKEERQAKRAIRRDCKKG
jgi:hypothetical protein